MGVGGSGRRPATREPSAKSSRDIMRRKTLGKVRVCYACLLDDVIPEPDHPSGQRVLQLLGAQRPDDAPETSQGGILESATLVLKEPGRLDGPAKVGIGEIFPERYGGGKARAQGGRNQPLWWVRYDAGSLPRDPATTSEYPVADGESQTRCLGGAVVSDIRITTDEPPHAPSHC